MSEFQCIYIDQFAKVLRIIGIMDCHYRQGVLKLWTCTILMYFGFLNFDFVNQIWKFMCRCFGKFSCHLICTYIFSDNGFSIELKLDFRLKV